MCSLLSKHKTFIREQSSVPGEIAGFFFSCLLGCCFGLGSCLFVSFINFCIYFPPVALGHRGHCKFTFNFFTKRKRGNPLAAACIKHSASDLFSATPYTQIWRVWSIWGMCTQTVLSHDSDWGTAGGQGQPGKAPKSRLPQTCLHTRTT